MSAHHVLTYVIAFVGGVGIAWAVQRRLSQSASAPGASQGPQPILPPAVRPASQIPIRSFDEIVAFTSTELLLQSIEQRTRLSKAAFATDCLPVLRGFAQYVQMLPASESHHHAQPGGLWIHVLEVVDAALAFRNGMELPRGATTEDRKRLEHRYTYGVMLAALLHDVGKPFADMRVTLYGEDPRIGKPWAAIAGPMNGASHYSVEFTPSSERDYGLHQRLPAMIMQKMVPEKTLKWLSDHQPLLSELIRYLSGEKPHDSAIAEIVKSADADSVKRNLLSGPRTRFASARVRPLIERLLEALRRMLKQGGVLPLNKPGAVGWVYDGSIWFVCARLADDIRDYLAKNESPEGVPGPDMNDRIFDEFQDYGACRSNPDGTGAIWKVSVELENWRSPRELTVLRFDLDKLFPTPAEYPESIVGKVVVIGSANKAAPIEASQPTSTAAGANSTSTLPQPTSQATTATALPSKTTTAPAISQAISPVAIGQVPSQPSSPAPVTSHAESAVGTSAQPSLPAATAPESRPAAATVMVAMPPDDEDDLPCSAPMDRSLPAPVALHEAALPAATLVASCPAPVVDPETAHPAAQPALQSRPPEEQDVLPATDRASTSALRADPVVIDEIKPFVITNEVDIKAPQRPFEKPKKGPKPAKDATPAANAFLHWVQSSVANGHLKYNEPNALVHFAPEGMLLFSPEIFRRFIQAHAEVTAGPVAALLASHGDKAFQRLQNEVAKSPYTVRNGDENLHYYAFTKHDGGVSTVSSYFLVGQPQLFFNPVPPVNPRIIKSGRPAKRLKPVGVSSTNQA